MSALTQLFLTFTQIGLLSIGGGYAIIPLIQEQVVRQLGWISQKTLADIITISQMTPGPLAVNTSTFVGLQIGGLPGAVAASVGAVIGGVILSIGLHKFFEKYRFSAYVREVLEGLKSASLGLIVSAAVTILLLSFYGSSVVALSSAFSGIDWFAALTFLCSLFLMRSRKMNPMLVIALCGLAGVVIYG